VACLVDLPGLPRKAAGLRRDIEPGIVSQLLQ
jgi:hypothetical protein